MAIVSSLVFFGFSSLRHALFQSGAYDLGIFDQAIYLISQGQAPISSFLGFHILGDHAAWIFYPLALLYRVHPSVHWLLAIQALALGLGVLPLHRLVRQAGLAEAQAIVLAIVYLLYPLIFNVNLFDFHPEVLALPCLLTAVWAARAQRLGVFCLSLLIILGCKAVLALTIAALGLGLLVFEKRRGYGAIALLAGVSWFFIATQWVIPNFGGATATIERHAARYSFLGRSIPEILHNFLLRPDLLLGKLFSLSTLEYLLLLLIPVIWGLSWQAIGSLIGALPTLMLNLLSDFPAQRNLVFQYSLPMLPFLFLAIIETWRQGRGWLRQRWKILAWSLVAFLALAKVGYFGSIYLNSLDTWQATNAAIAQIPTQGSVLTTHNIAPHLAHRAQVQFTNIDTPPRLEDYDYVLLNLRHPGWQSNPEFAVQLLQQVQRSPTFAAVSQGDSVYLFKKTI
ncbi:MAG: DUF2079 domain-containing protein [Scytolyngbya sp. HA4215-MV1]|nr:DUF2079 domain-containing protein [Scytolyngbya sp. HA4215-MV1]